MRFYAGKWESSKSVSESSHMLGNTTNVFIRNPYITLGEGEEGTGIFYIWNSSVKHCLFGTRNCQKTSIFDYILHCPENCEQGPTQFLVIINVIGETNSSLSQRNIYIVIQSISFTLGFSLKSLLLL